MPIIFVSNKIFSNTLSGLKVPFVKLAATYFFKQLNNNNITISIYINLSALKLWKATSFQHTGTNNTKEITAYSFLIKAMINVHSLFQYFFRFRLIKQDLQEKLFQKLALPVSPKLLWWLSIWPSRKVVKQIIIRTSKNQNSCAWNQGRFLIEKWLGLYLCAKLSTLLEPSAMKWMNPMNHFHLGPG